jgi:chorismate mutase
MDLTKETVFAIGSGRSSLPMQYRQTWVSPSCALILIAVSQVAEAEVSVKDSSAAKELVELIADRVEDLAESVAKDRWNRGALADDDKSDAVNSDLIIFKASLDGNFAESFSKAQLAAFKERQRQLFAKWKAAGTDGFDEVDDSNSVVRSQLEKNAREEAKRLVDLKPSLCSANIVTEMDEVATPILKKRSIDKAPFKHIFESFEVASKDESSGCRPNKPQ